MNRSQLQRKLSAAIDRLEIERRNVELARKKRDYWSSVVHSYKVRLGLIREGQTEFDGV